MNDVAIVGAGPHGILVAAHCRRLGLDFRLFGKSMDSWQHQMPAGMRLKSSPAASNIGEPNGAYSLPNYEAKTSQSLATPLPVEDFVAYGKWVQAQAAPDLDSRLVMSISKNGAFSLRLEDGETVIAKKVVLALGINKFASVPSEFAGVPGCLAAHTSQVGPLERFRGKRVLVVGAGQSAQESAALLHEQGADVEIITRRAELPRLGRNRGLSPLLRRLVPEAVYLKIYPPTDLGRQPDHLAIAYPEIFRKLPERWKRQIAWGVLKPAAARWLMPRLAGVAVTASESVVKASPRGRQLELELSDGSTRVVDFALLATGFKPDLQRLGVLDCKLLQAVAQYDGQPALSLGFETSVKGLHTIGAIASGAQGPIARFVCGTLVYGRLLMPSLCR
ncbi:MAG TPA: NAD(P)-binding domain-containing protein [Chloroflexota bacterium]|nr:NAD(P)-binding domain-containing protein [Chloroflexota bacterium]